MLIDISVTNFRSIKDKQTFSMVARDRIKEYPDNTYKVKKKSFLKSSIIYGANGSGKSNLIKAFDALKRLVQDSASYKVNDAIIYSHVYLLEGNNLEKPVEIEINFIAKDNLQYNYSIAFTSDEFINEELSFYPGKNPALLFKRKKGEKIIFGPSVKQDLSRIVESLYDNQLLLSKVGSEKVDNLINAYTFLTRHLSVYNVHNTSYDNFLVQMYSRGISEFNDLNLKHNIAELMKVADIGIKNITIEKDEKRSELLKSMSDEEKKSLKDVREYDIHTSHRFYNNDVAHGELKFSISMESTGTNKLLVVGLFLLEALRDGDVIVIDELDKSLHPYITKLLIRIVNSSRTNPKNAQLIFASHDVSLLDNKIFRRDQIHFAEKTVKGDSNYYSLGDIQGVRKTLPYEKYYLKGIFGGIPLINEYDLDFIFE